MDKKKFVYQIGDKLKGQEYSGRSFFGKLYERRGNNVLIGNDWFWIPDIREISKVEL